MSNNIENMEEFGPDLISIIDDEGNEFELEVLESLEYKGQSYMAFLPTDMDEDDPDYGMIILRVILEESGEILYEDVDNEEELTAVYEEFAEILFEEEDE